MSRAEIGLAILIVYLTIGTFLWLSAIKTFGGMDEYRQFVNDKANSVPIPFIFLVFVIGWPFFLRRK
jgi:hypothetical protein